MATAANRLAGDRAPSPSRQRAWWQARLWWLLPAIIVVGWWYPLLGWLVPLCWIGALVLAGFQGRTWCDHACPRGGFHDHVLGNLGRRRTLPAGARHWAVRLAVMAVLMTVLGVNLARVWGDWSAMGRVFLLVLTVTTVAGALLGLILHQRTWCAVCPAGTMANWLGRGKPPVLKLDEARCTDCSVCARVCPLDLRPVERLRRSGRPDPDCLKCGVCTEKCPRQALALVKEGRL